MPVVFFLRQFLADMIDFAGIGFVAYKRSDVELVLLGAFDSGVFPEVLKKVAKNICIVEMIFVEYNYKIC